jgi:fructoselysine 3-epimerase
MYLAYSTNGFTRRSLPDAVRAIGALGYTGVELLADAPHWVPGESDAASLAELRRAVAETGLRISNINGNTAAALWPHPPPEPVFEPALSNRDPDVRARRIDYTKGCLELAAAVGADCVSVTSGRTQAEVPPQEGMRYFAESLATLCEFAAGLGLRVGVEYEPALLVETSSEVAWLIERVGAENLGANLDVGHAVCAGEDPHAAIARLAGRIWNVHLEDIAGGKHYHLVPGEGDLDFDAVLDSLARIGYDRALTVELYTCADFDADAARRAFAHLAPRLRG